MKKSTIAIIALLMTASFAQASKPTQKRVEPASIVYDVASNRVIHSVNSDRIISIASMTKMVTVLTVLEADQNLGEFVPVRGKETSSRISRGMLLTRYDLIELAMVSSDNLAARTLIEHYPGGYESGIQAMNQLVRRLGAENTTLVDPTGIMGANTSTAEDLVKITQQTVDYPIFQRFANQTKAEVRAERVSRTKRAFLWIVGRTTNPFAHETNNFEIISFKTGLTSAAGWCLTMLVSYNNRQYILVTAGNRSKQARRMQADQLIQTITDQQYQIKVADSSPALN
jgi:serine-type D-Ala-D-Ala endopeptidase (penicillin-binding protein 7)